MVTDAAVVAPKRTRVVSVMLVPVIVTVVPPAVDPELGVALVMVGGGAMNVNAVRVSAVPYGDLTVTPTDPET